MCLGQGWRTVWRACAEWSVNFEEMLSRARGNFEAQNNIFGAFHNYYFIIIIIIIIINAYYNYNCIIHDIMITLLYIIFLINKLWQ